MTAPGRDLSPQQASATATGMLAAAELARGDLVAERYRIEQMLGIGGMGVVYRAHDLQLDVPVALKLLRPELASRPDAFARFRQELLLARQVSSPHVVRIHDLVQHKGMWLISMDFVPGSSLEKRLDTEGAMTSDAALGIIRQVALGLAAAHERGVIHRDLKPANILVTDSGEAFISDFGVARSAAHTGITGTGVVVGTPEYLSPEQARAERVDGRSDLYTLGLILYELLAGQVPFHGSTAAESLGQRIVRSPPPLRRARPAVEAWVDALCGRLLALKPSHRLQTARAVVDAIDRRRVAPPPGLWRRRLSIALVAVALLGAAAWWWQRPPAPALVQTLPTLDLMLLPVRVVDPGGDADQAFADGLSRWLWTSLAASPQLSADAGRMQILLRLLDFDAESAARNSGRVRESLPAHRVLAPQLVHEGNAWSLRIESIDAPGAPAIVIPLPDVASAQWGSSQLFGAGAALPAWPGREALAALGRAIALPDDADTMLQAAVDAAPSDPVLWRERLSHADRHLLPNHASGIAERALVALEGVTGHDATVARAHARLLLSDATQAQAELRPALATAPSDLPAQRLWARISAEVDGPEAAIAPLQAVVRQDPQDPRAWSLLGRYTLLGGDARRAVDDYLVRALVIALRIGDTQAAAEARNAMGIGYERLGQTQAAIENFGLAADARERAGDRIGAVNSLRNLAVAEAVRGDTVAADRAFDRAEAILEGIDAPLARADLQNDRGLLAEERGDFRAALDAYRDALALRQAAGGDADVAESQYNVGFAYYHVGEFDNALVYWQQSEAEYTRRQDEAGRLRSKQSLALLDGARGAWASARSTLEQAIRDAEARQMTEEHAVGLNSLAELDRLQGRLDAALDHNQRSARLFAQRQDQRGMIEAALQKVAILIDAAAWEQAGAALAELAPDDSASAEQQAMHAMRRAQVALGLHDAERAATALAEAAGLAGQAHSQPIAIQVDLLQAQLAQLNQDAVAATAAMQRARDDLVRFAPQALSLLVAETAMRLGDVSAYEHALSLLRRSPEYGRAYAIHHGASQAFAKAGQRAAADAARNRWRTALDGVREGLSPTLRGSFDTQPEAQDPGA